MLILIRYNICPERIYFLDKRRIVEGCNYLIAGGESSKKIIESGNGYGGGGEFDEWSPGKDDRCREKNIASQDCLK